MIVRKILYILAVRKRNLLLLLALFMCSSALELLGIGIVFPYLAIVSNPDGWEKIAQLRWLEPVTQAWPHDRLVIYLTVLLVGVYVLKNACLFFTHYGLYRYLQGIQRAIKLRLFRAYLFAPFQFHLRVNSAVLINNAVQESMTLTEGPLMGMLMLVAEGMFLLFIAGTLLYVSPLSVLVVVFFAVFVWLFHRLTKRKIDRYGRTRLLVNIKLIKIITEAMKNLKLTRLVGAESYFLRQAENYSRPMAVYCARFSTLLVTPRLTVEVLVVSFLGAVVVFLVLGGQDLVAMLPAMGVLGATAMRIMPSGSRIINGLSVFMNARCVIEKVYQNLKEVEAYEAEQAWTSTGEALPFTRAVEFKGVTFRYPTSPGPVLEDVNLTIPRGGSVGIVGRSGSGKSTLVNILLGLLHPDQGEVRVDGRSIAGNLPAWRCQLGYVPQDIHLSDDSVRRNIAFGVEDADIDPDALARAVRAAALEETLAELPHGLDTIIGEDGIRLSGGQRQRVGIARALYRDPQVLVFDEATSSLDTETEAAVNDAVRALKGKMTMVIVAHRMSTVENCDTLVRLERGRIVRSGVFAEVVP